MFRRRRLAISFLLLAVVSGCAHVRPKTPAFGRVEGRVLDIDGLPMAHVALRILLEHEICAAETDRSGVFVFSGLPPRPEYTLCILGELHMCTVVKGPNLTWITFAASEPRH